MTTDSELTLLSFDRSLNSFKDHLATLQSHPPPQPQPLPLHSTSDLSRRYLDLLHQFNLLLSSSNQSISSYDHNRLLSTLNTVRAHIDRLSHSITTTADRPGKKFTFSRPLKPPVHVPRPSTPPSSFGPPTNLPVPSSDLGPLSGFNGLSAVLVRPTTTVLSPLHTLALVDLSTAVLDLRALTHLGSLHLVRLRDAALVAPPLAGSAFCDQVHRSIVLVVAQQLRIHRSGRVAMLVHSHTPPVLEDSTELTVAPYPAHLFPVPHLAPSNHAVPQDFDHPSCADGSPNVTLVRSCPVDEDSLVDVFAGPTLDPGKHYEPMPERTRAKLRALLETLFPKDSQ